jgi:hypothetical protein
MITDLIVICLFAAMVAALLFMFFILVKNENTCKQRKKINKAIYHYRIFCAREKITAEVDYVDNENYDKTLFRLWDWGCTRILPKEKYEIIKPYIKE